MARIHRRTRHDEDLAGLFGGVLGGDQRARPGGRLDHDDPGGQAADDAVAAREGPGNRRRPERRLRQQQTERRDRLPQDGVLRRIDLIDAAGPKR